MTDLKTNFKARTILKEDLSTEEVAYIESKISNLAEKYDMYRHADGITYSKREPYKGLDDFHAGIAFCVSLNKKEYRNYFSAIYSYSYLEGVRHNAITNESILLFKNVEQEESEDLPGLESVLGDAIEIAVRFHKGQKDKNDEPYIFHTMRVMMNCHTNEEKIVAVLHDVLEDTQCTEAYLEGVLESVELLDAVRAITRNSDENYFDYINRVKENPIARIVKIADLTDNLSRKGASNSLRERYCKALKILGADIEKTVVMSPEEFYEKMKYCFNESDLGDAHVDADMLMCNVLESLGYGEGIKVFKSAEKWYS